MSSYRDLAPRPQDSDSAAAGDSKVGVANRTPSRVAAACVTCRARRTKVFHPIHYSDRQYLSRSTADIRQCDGGTPACRSCVKRNSSCRYDPPTGTLLAQAQKRKIEELENDKSSLYEVVWYLQTTSPDKATALLRYMRAAQGEDLGVIFKNFEMSCPESSVSATTSKTNASGANSSSVMADSPSSALLTMPEIMDHPQFSTVRTGQAEVTGIALLAPNQQDASVDKINGPLEMFFNCVGALFYIMNRDDVQISITALKASGNGHTPLGDMFNNGSRTQLRTYAAELAGMVRDVPVWTGCETCTDLDTYI